MTVPLDQGRPVWVDDEDFDLAYHVRLTALPPPGHARSSSSPCSPASSPTCSTGAARCGSCGSSRACRTAGRSPSSRRRTTAWSTASPASTSPPCSSTSSPRSPRFDAPPWRPSPPPSERPAAARVASSSGPCEPAEIVRSVRAALRGPRQRRSSGPRTSAQAVDQRASAGPEHAVERARSRRTAAGCRCGCRLEDVKAIKDAASADRAARRPGVAQRRRARRGHQRSAHVPPRRATSRAEDLVLKAMVPVTMRSKEDATPPRGGSAALGNRVSMMNADLPVGDRRPGRAAAAFVDGMRDAQGLRCRPSAPTRSCR